MNGGTRPGHRRPPIAPHARRRLLATAVILALCGVVAEARALSPEALRSVVSVLPEWPREDLPTTGRDARPLEPEGSAVAVLPGGYLATSAHVLGRASRIRVRLDDGRLFNADIVGADDATDIALLRIPVDLPVPPAGPEPALTAPVCAAGNAFGLDLSVTCGVVSALHRSGTGFNAIEDFIQTDAAVNPGASGGALFDAEDRLIGLVSAIFTKGSDANIGVNFAASLALVMRVVVDLKEHGRVLRARSGVRVEDARPEEGAPVAAPRVTEIAPKGAAEGAGLKQGDIVVAIAGRRIARASDVAAAFYLRRPGERVEVTVVRAGARHTAELVLGP